MERIRRSSIDADLFSDQEEIFHDIQGIKERLNINVEFARPEHFVPALRGSAKRHVFLETIDNVSFYHYDPYAQILSKLVRGFERDLDDAHHFMQSGMVDGQELRSLVEENIGVSLFEVSEPVPLSGVGSRLRFSLGLKNFEYLKEENSS